MTDEDSLEDMVKKLSRNLPKFVDLRTFERMTLKIIHKLYDPTAMYESAGGHSKRIVVQFKDTTGKKQGLQICQRQKGSESVVSTGIFKGEVEKLAQISSIPQRYLEVYIKGSGNLYKKFIKKLEEKYGI